MEKFYITTTIPYVNAPPHIGHALEFVQADAIARYQRKIGKQVYFLSGSDENAMKNVQSAEKQGIPVEDLVEENAMKFKKLLSQLDVSIDQFIRTTEERHRKGAQALWNATKKEDLYKKIYSGLYCAGCETFYKEEELNEEGECPEHPGKKPEMIEEENYFFRLSHYASWLEELITTDTLKIVPEFRKNEVLSFIRSGLEDFSVSRSVQRSKGWGVPVPEDERQTMYVWYDALANYITALGYPDEESRLFRDFWKEGSTRLHILGKGVSRFHAVYWPAMLKSAGIDLPTQEFIHGYITTNGQKISKTLGNVIDPSEIISKFGTDALRYWFLREVSTFEDGDFTQKKFRESYNGNLAKGLGNLVSRIIKMARNYAVPFEERNPEFDDSPYHEAMEKYEIQKAADFIWSRIQETDRFIQEAEPFKTIKTDPERAKKDIKKSLERLWNVSELLEPFLPSTSESIQNLIQDSSLEMKPMFPRADQ